MNSPPDEPYSPSDEPRSRPDEPRSRPDEPYVFPHPDWTVGLVLVFAVVSLAFGLLVRPIFLVIGSPFILVLLLWIIVRLVGKRENA